MIRTSPAAWRGLSAGMATVMLCCVAPVAHADDPTSSKSAVDSRIQQTQDDLDLVSGKLKDASDALARTDKAVAKAAADKKAKDDAYTKAAGKATDTSGDLKLARADEAKSKKALTDNSESQTKTKKLVGALARHSYETGGLGKLELTLQVLMTKDDPTDQLSLADIVMNRQGTVLTKLSGEKAIARAETSRLSATTRRIAGLKIAADGAASAAKKASDDAKTAQDSLLAVQKTQRADKKKLEDQKAADLKALTKDKSESASLGKLIKARADAAAKAAGRSPVGSPASSAPAGAGGFLTPPAAPSAVVSGFGWRVNPVLGVKMLHEGDDFPFACGTNVLAAADGTVAAERSDSVGGNNITIDHGFVKGVYLSTYYAHLTRFVAANGAKVTKGQVIGISGSTGRSTGCHLHFGVLENGTFVDPSRWIG